MKTLKGKLKTKKEIIKQVIKKKIEDNVKELIKWRDLLFLIVDESLDEKINKLNGQQIFFEECHKDISKVLKEPTNQNEDDSDNEDEPSPPKADDLLTMELRFQPEGITANEMNEMDSAVKRDFTKLLSEPKKTLRRTFAYVGGIIRGFLRRGKVNIDWIAIMRSMEKQ